ncbi:DUF1573 domain-containing protein [Flavihumibacter sp. R14]|nr:DUF1573 domain-containing protein [Flavihumibacter soli]
MKRLFLSVITVIAFSACNNEKTQTEAVATSNNVSASVAPVADAANAAAFKFEKESYDFGQITEGEKVSYEFAFTNNGKEPMIITGATATCGCTVPEYPHEPIGPGESGKISVVFDSAGKSGMQNKVISITANTNPAVTQLHLIGDVKPKSK